MMCIIFVCMISCRYFLVEKAKDANIIGILVGTLNVGVIYLFLVFIIYHLYCYDLVATANTVAAASLLFLFSVFISFCCYCCGCCYQPAASFVHLSIFCLGEESCQQCNFFGISFFLASHPLEGCFHWWRSGFTLWGAKIT